MHLSIFIKKFIPQLPKLFYYDYSGEPLQSCGNLEMTLTEDVAMQESTSYAGSESATSGIGVVITPSKN